MSHKILVVDDEPRIRELLKRFLTKLGYGVRTVESGTQAIEAITQKPFSLVLCDIMMPGLDGLTTLTKIKELNKSLPVLMMSGAGTHDRLIKALEKGAADFIAKPVNFIQLKKTIQQNLKPPAGPPQEQTSIISHLLRESYLGLLKVLIQLLETKDPYIKDHGKRVSEYATKLAQALHLSEDTVEVINYASIIHDIGKIGVKDTTLLKADKLTTQEWTEIRKHPIIGSGIVEQLKFFRFEEPLIRHHHERYDGAGYPSGLSKETIPLGARILSIADAYDAMTSARPYRQAFNSTTACQRIKDGRSKQFDPQLTNVFVAIISGDLNNVR